MHMGKAFFCLLLVFYWLSSCSQPECNTKLAPRLQVKLVLVEESSQSRTEYDTAQLAFTSIRADQSPPDSLVYQNTTPLNVISLPLNPGASETTFRLEASGQNLGTQKLSEFFTIGYTPRRALISEACGFTTYYDDLQVLNRSRTLLDSLRLLRTSVNENRSEIHLYLYFRGNR
jgi:hypothetical protein